MKVTREGIEKKFFEMCLECVEAQGLELYDLEYIKGQKTLRLFIMNKETKTANLDDCILVDRSLTPYFEENTWIPEDVTLEVSSPGIYKKLRLKEHFEMVLGERVKLKFRGNLEGVDPKVAKKIASTQTIICLLYTSPSPRDQRGSRMPSSA